MQYSRKRIVLFVVIGLGLAAANSATALAQGPTVEARVLRLEYRLAALTDIVLQIEQQVVGGGFPGQSPPGEDPFFGALSAPGSEMADPTRTDKRRRTAGTAPDTRPDMFALSAARRPDPGALPEPGEDESAAPGAPTPSRPKGRLQPRSAIGESRPAPPTGASDDEATRRISDLQRRVAAVTEIARRKQSRPSGGLTPSHRAQLAELESQVELLESLLTSD